MESIRRAALFACAIFAGAVAGHLLQWLLPAQHISDAKGVIGAVQGLITALLALVLGLLVWTSYGVYAQQYSEMMSLAGEVLALDVALDRLERDAPVGRALLGEQLDDMRRRFWGHDGECGAPLPYPRARAELGRVHAFYSALAPATDAERAAVDEARTHAAAIVSTILLMGRQLRNPLPGALINSVVMWAILVFCCLGTTAALNPLSVVAEGVGAVSVASAVFLIMEFSQPYSGYFRILPGGMDERIESIARRAQS